MSAVIEAARQYLGVPFKHRGRTDRGIDCAGLVWCAYRDLGVIKPDLKRYGREPFRDGLMRALIEGFGEPVWQGAQGQVVPRELLKVGDVALIRFEVHPHHIVLIGEDKHHGLSFLHADGTFGVSRVVEHGLTDRHLRTICAVFRER